MDDLVTHGILVLSAVCLTLGFINLRFWFGERNERKFLALGAACISVAVFSWFEIAWLKAETPSEFAVILRWSHIPSAFTICAVGVFLYLQLGAGRKWMLYTIVGLRSIGLIANFLLPVNLVFKEITSIGHITVLGENLSYPIGTPSYFVVLVYAATLLLVIFSIDASISTWRRGDRRMAIVIGGSMGLFAVLSSVLSLQTIFGSGRIPAFVSPSFLLLLAALALELNYDVKRSARLSRELSKRESELSETMQQLDLSAEAAHVGVWARQVGSDRLWTNQHWRDLFEFVDSDKFTYADWLKKIHPEDRERVTSTMGSTEETGEPYQMQYRVQLADGGIRWISSMGQAHDNGDGEVVRGASVDITQLKFAEQDAHELSRKLMNAQEKERARLARELHDDLSQSLALLSIQLQSIADRPAGTASVKKQVGNLTDQIQRLSSDVHRISHELHPSKLNQLGLEAALRGFCREVGAARRMKIGFDAANVPRDLANDISLCLYRIAQESLQNAVKHSGASSANIELKCVHGEIKLVVSDNGCGFDPEAVRSKESLGLISMDERIRAVRGTLTIESVPDSGTKIKAVVPWSEIKAT